MISRHVLLLVILSVCTASAASQGGKPRAGSSGTTLPMQVRDYLDKNYPAWKLSSKTTGCNKDFERAVVAGDFDGDRLRDYVVKFIAGSSGYIIAFLSRGTDYKTVILESGSQEQIRNQGLSVARTGTKYPEIVNENFDRVTRRLQHDAPVGGACESSTYFYIWENGLFKRAFVSD